MLALQTILKVISKFITDYFESNFKISKFYFESNFKVISELNKVLINFKFYGEFLCFPFK